MKVVARCYSVAEMAPLSVFHLSVHQFLKEKTEEILKVYYVHFGERVPLYVNPH